MSGGDFLDSNVIVYAFNRTDLRKHQITRRLIEETPPNELAISFQVVGETLNVLTQKFTPRMPLEEAQSVLTTTLQLFWRVHPSPDLYSAALNLKDRYEYTFYDSLIIAAALEAGCERLLSEDLQHGQRIDGLTIVNPFLET